MKFFIDRSKYLFISIIILLGLVVLASFFLVRAPKLFPSRAVIEIEKGLTISEVSERLRKDSVIGSPFLFKVFVTLLSPKTGVIAGDYIFPQPESLFGIVSKVTNSAFNRNMILVTLPEGFDNREIAKILASKLKNFDEKKFVEIARAYEGYLFPDTYIVARSISEEEMIRVMKQNFDQKIMRVKSELETSPRDLKSVITMASLIEGEVRTWESRQMVSGILWKRIDEGMLLQVDATFVYILGKGSLQLSEKDLRVDSPYNTYLYKGLPPGPINNPGLQTIRAALSPKESPYFFYLSDRSGNMHYAKNFEEHKNNKARYLY